MAQLKDLLVTGATRLINPLQPHSGGTGKTNNKDAANAFMNALDTGITTPVDADYYISQYVSGGTTTTTYHRRPMSALWAYIQSKISSVLGLTATTYNGDAATVNGHTINIDVPANAVFTDTKNTAGSTDTSSKIFLVGATSQADNPQTYSHDTAYVGTDGCLYSGGTKVLTAHQDISGKLNTSLKGAANGLAELDANGKVPSAQLPSYVDDVLEYTAKANFPATGETGKIYVDTTTNLTYRWSGSAYVEISPSLALGETSSTAYRGDRGKIAYDHSQSTHARTDATAVTASTTNGNIKINGTETTVYTHPGSGTNPHGTTKTDVGLGNVGNFKAVSTVASQGLTDTEKSNARANIGAGTSSLTLGTSSSTAYRGDYGNSAYTHAVTNKGSAFTSGLYKITTNSEGHVTAATAVVKADITGLGIPAQDTTYESKAAASGGTDVSLVTTGEKYTWNNKLSSHQTIKQDGITGATINRFGTCTTAAATAAKAVSITTGTFNLEAGARISVKFNNANTANSPTLNVNSKGAKNIFHKGAQITSGSNKALLAGVVDFIYDGTQWHLIGNYIDTNTTYTASTSKLVTTTVPNVTSVGSAPTLGTAIAADDITSWSAGSVPTLGTAIPADDITAWTTNTPTMASVSGGVLTLIPGSAASLSYTAKSIPNVTSVGSLPSLSYTARSIPNVTSVGSAPTLGTAITVATGSLASNGSGETVATGIAAT